MSIWQGMGDDERKAVRAGIFVFGGLALGGATVLVAKKAVSSTIENLHQKREERESTEAGNPASFAMQLKMAFENDNYLSWGTDEEVIFQVIKEIPTRKMWEQVQQSYFRLYQKQLNSDLKEELSTVEQQQVLRILASKP